ncbi:hypothetical protein [Maribacter halichondriae]|uniref:hypothetical protein n=1 Tax=Maribacter halichondriae TaxID=2980554 RepID=UPI002358BF84|nr:hypothetical protein [Maribacter sp. Hal144]
MVQQRWSRLGGSYIGSPFLERYNHTTVVYDNRIWVIGGFAGELKKDVWYSFDSLNWLQPTSAVPFTERSSHTSIVFDSNIWVIGGFDGELRNDVWTLD